MAIEYEGDYITPDPSSADPRLAAKPTNPWLGTLFVAALSASEWLEEQI